MSCGSLSTFSAESTLDISGILSPGEDALVILGHELAATVFPF
jgi:hypothetical protein